MSAFASPTVAVAIDDGHITGTLTNATGDGLPDCYVDAYTYDATYGYWSYAGSGSTDSSGAYDVGALATGTYRLEFYDSTETYISEYYEDAATLDSATDVDVSAGATTSDIDAVLTSAGHITGTVRNVDGDELSSVQVTAYTYNATDDYWDWVGEGNTDSSGAYDVGGLEAGAYRLRFTDPAANYLSEYYDDADDVDSAADVNVTAESTTSDIDAVLTAAGHITGTVTNVSGDALSDVLVTTYRYVAYDDYWDPIESGYTDSAGTYDVAGLTTGAYRVRFSDENGVYAPEYYNNASTVRTAADVNVTTGLVTEGIDASLSEGGHITGMVKNAAGDGLSTIRVSAYRTDAAGDENYEWSGYTDSSGAYDVGGLASGTYSLEFYDRDGIYLSEYYNDAATPESAADVDVTAGNTTSGINAVLTEGGHVTGTVKNAAGDALSNISVEVYTYYAAEDYWDWAGDGYTTGSSGAYDIAGLRTGTYRLQFSDQDGNYLSEYYNDASNLDSATDVKVTAGTTTSGIDSVLTAAGHITGTVKNAAGDALSDVRVTVYESSEDGEWWSSTDGYTDATGAYDVAGLTTGSYRLQFSDENGVYSPEFYSDAASVGAAANINVTTGAVTSGIDAVLAVGGHISGTVKNAAGDALPTTYVTVYQYNVNGVYWESVGSGESDASGAYNVGGLATGAYRVEFSPDSEVYAPGFYSNATTLETGTDVNVMVGSTTSDINAVLVFGGHITGTVKNAAGEPLPSVNVSIYRYKTGGSFDWIDSDYTNSTGAYDIGGLPAGAYRIRFADQDGVYATEYYNNAETIDVALDVSVAAGATTTGIDAVLGTRGVVTGTVKNAAGTGLAGIQVMAYRYYADEGWWDQEREAYTDSTGKYSLSGLDSGIYRLRFSDDNGIYLTEYYSDAADLDAAVSVSVLNGATRDGVDAVMGAASCTIVPTAGAHGAISPAATQTVTAGSSSATFTITPDAGYHVADVKVDGVSVAALTHYKFANVAVNHTISATFAIDVAVTYTIVPTAGAHGAISPAATQTVTAGSSSATFTITPDAGYHVADVKVDGVSVGAVTSYKFANVTVNHTIEATFVQGVPTVTLTSKSTTLKYYLQSFYVKGTLTIDGVPAPGQTVVLRASANGKTFTDTKFTAVTDASGNYSFKLAPVVKTWYRVRGTSGVFAGIEGAAVCVTPRASVGTPSVTKKTVKVNKAFTVSGSLKSRHKARTSPIRVYKDRLVKGHWKGYGYVKAKVANYKTYSKFTCKVKLSKKGTWRLRAYHVPDSGHAATWSKARSMKAN